MKRFRPVLRRVAIFAILMSVLGSLSANVSLASDATPVPPQESGNVSTGQEDRIPETSDLEEDDLADEQEAAPGANAQNPDSDRTIQATGASGDDAVAPTGGIHIIVVDASDPTVAVPGGAFSLTDASGGTIHITDGGEGDADDAANGTIAVTELPAGDASMVQTATSPGYAVVENIPVFTVVADVPDTRVTVENAPSPTPPVPETTTMDDDQDTGSSANLVFAKTGEYHQLSGAESAIIYAYTITNNGTVDATDVEMEDGLLTEVDGVPISWVTADQECTTRIFWSARLLECDFETIAAGETLTYNFAGIVLAGLDCGSAFQGSQPWLFWGENRAHSTTLDPLTVYKTCETTTPATIDWTDTGCIDGALIDPTFSRPADGNGVTYTTQPDPYVVASGATIVVTASLANDHAWETMNGWARSADGRSATYSITFDDPPCSADVSISKSGPDSINPGETITYTMTVNNAGTADASVVVVTDILPHAESIDWSTDKGTITGGTLSYTIETLSARGEDVITITGVIPADGSVCGEITNTASFTAGDHGDNSNTVITDIDCQPDLGVTKSVQPATVGAGGELTWSINLTNTGTTDASDVTVNDPLPAGFILDNTVLPDACTHDPITHTVSCTVDVPLGTTADAPVIITLAGSTSADGSSCGPITNTISAPGGLTASASATVDCGPNITIEKNADRDTVSPGDVVEFTITVANDGFGPATGVSFTDDLPGGLTWSWTENGGAPALCERVEGSLVCDGIDIDAGDEFVVTLSAPTTATSPACGEIRNFASLTAPHDGSSSATVTIACKPALSLTRDVNPALIDAPDTISYTFVVTNTGNQPLPNVTIADLFTTPVINERAWQPGYEHGVMGALTPGQEATITATLDVTQVEIDAGKSIVHCATAMAETTTSSEICLTVTIDQDPSLVLSKDATQVNGVDAPGAVSGLTVGDVVTYSLVATNDGNVTLHAVEIVDSRPISDIACRVDDTRVTNGNVTLGPGASLACTGTYTVLQMDIDNQASIVNTATASGTHDETDVPSNPAEEIVYPAIANPALAVTMTAGGADVLEIDAPQDVMFGFTITNIGSVTLSDLALEADVDLALLDCDPSIDGQQSLPAALGPGEEATCTVPFQVTQDHLDAGNDLTRTATVSGAAASPAIDTTGMVRRAFMQVTQERVVSAPGSATIRMVQSPALALAMTANPTSGARVGDTVTYTFTVTNTGNISLTGVQVTTVLPGLVWQGAHPDGAVGDLAPGAEATIFATYMITDADATAGSITTIARAESGAIRSPEADVTVAVVAPDPVITPTPGVSPTPDTRPTPGKDPTPEATPTDPTPEASPTSAGATGPEARATAASATGTTPGPSTPGAMISSLPVAGTNAGADSDRLGWAVVLLAAAALSAIAARMWGRPESG